MSYIPNMRTLMEAVEIEHWEPNPIEVCGTLYHVGWQTNKNLRNVRVHDGLSLADGIPVITDRELPAP